MAGVVFFFGIVAVFSSNLRAVNWRTIGWGIALQALLAVLVLEVDFVQSFIEKIGWLVQQLLNFTVEGAKFVFGNLYDARPPTKVAPGRDCFQPAMNSSSRLLHCRRFCFSLRCSRCCTTSGYCSAW